MGAIASGAAVPTLVVHDVRRALREAPGHPRRRPSARGSLTEDDVNAAMREIRLALLEADVNFKRRQGVHGEGQGAGARQRRPGHAQPRPAGRQDRQRGAHRAHGRRLGAGSRSPRARRPSCSWPACRARARRPRPPSSPRYLKAEHGSSVAVAACDVYRPAAVDQLVKVGGQAGATVYEQGTEPRPGRHRALGARPGQARRQGRARSSTPAGACTSTRSSCRSSRTSARRSGRTSILLVVDAMTGQDAVNVAEQFAEARRLRRRR